MRSGLIIFVFLAANLWAGMPAGADVSVQAHVDRTSVSPGESLQLSVTIDNGEGRVETDDIQGFKVYGQGTSTSVRMMGTRTTRQTTHNFLLIPQAQGRLTIPPLTVLVDGKPYQTDPITITVSEIKRRDDTQKEVWAEASVSNPKPFVGEPVTCHFSLYQAVRVTNASFEAPDFDGFSAKEIQERNSSRKVIDGREYVITEISYVLVPLSAGSQTISPAALQLGIVRADPRRRRSAFDDFFNDPFFNRSHVEPRVLRSNPVTVEVQPLPSPPQSAAFSGLVGRFELNANVEREQLKVGDSTTLTIEVRGHGNIMDAQVPSPAMPDTVKRYADAPEEQIVLNREGYSGKKVFRTALVPVTPGRVQLPPVRFTYFDVQTQQYQQLVADLPALQVAPAETSQAAPVIVTPDAPQPGKRQVAFTGRDILPLKEGLSAIASRQQMTWTVFVLWLLAPGSAVGGLALIQFRRRRVFDPATTMRRRAQQAMKSARMDTAGHQSFLTGLYRALTAAIFARAGRLGEALTWHEAEAILHDHGVVPETAREAADLLRILESHKFSGVAPGQEEQGRLLTRTRDMLRRLGC